MERIGLLVKNHDIPPEAILGLTFTRNAADEMRNRLVPVLGDLSERVFLATIHSFCYWLLKFEGQVFEILSGKDQVRFLHDVMKSLKYKDLAIGMVIREISLAKSNLIEISEFRDLYAGDKTMLKVADVFELYDRRKASKMLMDFDDLLVNAFRLLRSDDTVRQKYREIFRHLLVDEFQDTNPVQFEVLKLLLPSDDGNDSSFWVCGDDAQSIYGFTGASLLVGIKFICHAALTPSPDKGFSPFRIHRKTVPFPPEAPSGSPPCCFFFEALLPSCVLLS